MLANCCNRSFPLGHAKPFLSPKMIKPNPSMSLGLATRTDMFGPRCSTAQSATRGPRPPLTTPAPPVSFDSFQAPGKEEKTIEDGRVITFNGSAMNLCLAAFALGLVLCFGIGFGLFAVADKACFGFEECEARFPGSKWNCTGAIVSFGRVGYSSNGTMLLNSTNFPYALQDDLNTTFGPDYEYSFHLYDLYPVKGENLTIPKVWTHTCQEADTETSETANLTQAIAHSAVLATNALYPLPDGIGNWSYLFDNYVDFKDFFCTPGLECGMFAADLPGTELFNNATWYVA